MTNIRRASLLIQKKFADDVIKEMQREARREAGLLEYSESNGNSSSPKSSLYDIRRGRVSDPSQILSQMEAERRLDRGDRSAYSLGKGREAEEGRQKEGQRRDGKDDFVHRMRRPESPLNPDSEHEEEYKHQQDFGQDGALGAGHERLDSQRLPLVDSEV